MLGYTHFFNFNLLSNFSKFFLCQFLILYARIFTLHFHVISLSDMIARVEENDVADAANSLTRERRPARLVSPAFHTERIRILTREQLHKTGTALGLLFKNGKVRETGFGGTVSGRTN
jgi:hypothetical protein